MAGKQDSPASRVPRVSAADNGHIEVTGDLTFATVGELYSRNPPWVDGKADVRLDLGKVTKTDSAGLALLVEWLRRARRENVRLEVINMPEQMRTIARMSKLDGVIRNERA